MTPIKPDIALEEQQHRSEIPPRHIVLTGEPSIRPPVHRHRQCWWSSNPAAPPREARMSGEVMSHLQPLILAHNSLTERPDSFKLESCA